MSMKLGIEGGNMEITDDNQTIVSADIAKEIQDNTIKPDNKKDCEAPAMQIKESL